MAFRVAKEQYRSRERVIAKFVVSGGGATLTKISGNGNVATTGVAGQASNRDVASPITVAASVFTVVGPKCRLATLLRADYLSGSTAIASQLEVFPVGDYNTSAGTQQFVVLDRLGALGTMANGATLAFVWEIAK